MVLHRVNGHQERGRVLGFGNVARYSDASRFVHEYPGIMHRVKKDRSLREQLSYQFCRAKTIQAGHRNIQNHDVWTQRFGFFHSAFPVLGFSANEPMLLRLEKVPEASPHDLMVVNKKDSHPL